MSRDPYNTSQRAAARGRKARMEEVGHGASRLKPWKVFKKHLQNHAGAKLTPEQLAALRA